MKPRGSVYWDVYGKKFLSVIPPEDGEVSMLLAVDEEEQRIVTIAVSTEQLLLIAEDCRAAAGKAGKP